jgi:hypothetical protein
MKGLSFPYAKFPTFSQTEVIDYPTDDGVKNHPKYRIPQ